MNERRVLGLHHMSAICGPAQENVDFYAGVLGLRLIKLTVNYDDPTAYHLYYGDGAGTPGSVLTFFPYPHGHPGRPGAGQVTITALSTGPASLRYWHDRLKAHSVDVEMPRGKSMDFHAPDGLKLRLVAESGTRPTPFEASPIPAEHQIGPMRSITIEERSAEPLHRLLVDTLRLEATGDLTFAIPGSREEINLVVKENGPAARGGRGSVHHIAFRTLDAKTQHSLREELIRSGYNVSPIMDRTYFKSIYFREPGGVLFEVATDVPGFTVDEPMEALGSSLRLPAHFEPFRTKIERSLPRLSFPPSKTLSR